MNIAESLTRNKFPLSFNKIIKKTLAKIITLFLMGFALIMLLSLSPDFAFNTSLLGTFLLPTIILVILIYLYQRWYFAVYYYDINESFVVIRKGPITPVEVTIPFERIQDVYVDQDILDRIFGIYDVHISSATISSGVHAHIDGVEKTAAMGLRDELLSKVKSRIEKRA